MTTTSSTLKMAAARASSPAMAVASSCDCALSMAAADTAMETVRWCKLPVMLQAAAALHRYACITSGATATAIRICFFPESCHHDADLRARLKASPRFRCCCSFRVPWLLFRATIGLSFAVLQWRLPSVRGVFALLSLILPHFRLSKSSTSQETVLSSEATAAIVVGRTSTLSCSMYCRRTSQPLSLITYRCYNRRRCVVRHSRARNRTEVSPASSQKQLPPLQLQLPE